MKKLPLSFALTAAFLSSSAAMAADGPLSVTVGGSLREFLFVTDQDQAVGEDFNAFGMSNQVRVFLKGKAQLDNGLEVSTFIRLEAIGRKTEDVDEAYIDVKSAYGTLRMGEKEGWNATFVGDPAPTAFLTPEERVITDGIKNRNSTTQSDTFTFKRFAGDPLGIQYRSPDFGGFQFGLAYHPRTDNGAGPTDRAQINGDAIDASGIYTLKFDGGKIKLAGGYIRVGGRSVPGANAGQEAWNANVTTSYGPFTLGGTVLSTNPESGLRETDYTAGLLWTQGPWKLSGDYAFMTKRATATAVERDTTKILRGQVGYKLGPGIEVGAALFHTNQKDQTGLRWKGQGGVVGIKIVM